MQGTMLEQLRAGLHISASSLKTYLTCAWKFKLQYVEGARPEFRPSAMILGKAVHEALAVHHKAIQDGQGVAAPVLIEAFDESFSRGLEGYVPVQYGKDTADSLRQTGRSLVDLYRKEAKLQNIIGIEQPFGADLVDPRTGEIMDPKLVGVFDLVEEDEEGTVTVVELKTSARRWSAGQVNLDLQGSLYAEAVAQVGVVPENGEALIRYEILVKNKTPVLDRQYAVRRPGDREMARTIAVDALKSIEQSAFYRNPGWACGSCQFRKQCGV